MHHRMFAAEIGSCAHPTLREGRRNPKGACRRHRHSGTQAAVREQKGAAEGAQRSKSERKEVEATRNGMNKASEEKQWKIGDIGNKNQRASPLTFRSDDGPAAAAVAAKY